MEYDLWQQSSIFFFPISVPRLWVVEIAYIKEENIKYITIEHENMNPIHMHVLKSISIELAMCTLFVLYTETYQLFKLFEEIDKLILGDSAHFCQMYFKLSFLYAMDNSTSKQSFASLFLTINI